jgi:hypothetical protein
VHVRLDRRLALDIDTAEDYRHPLVAEAVTQLLGRPVT